MVDATYDRIGIGYREHRRGDPRIAAQAELDVGLRLVVSELDRDG